MTSPQSDVDVNVLVKIYNQRLASLQNQNVLLEAKVQTLLQDHEEEKEMLLANTMELQNKYELLQSKSSSKLF